MTFVTNYVNFITYLQELGLTKKQTVNAIGKTYNNLSHLKRGVYEFVWRLCDSNVAISCGNMRGWIEGRTLARSV